MRIKTALIIAAAIAATPAAVAYTDGPPPGHDGAPGNPDCSRCHSNHTAAEQTVRLDVSGLPEHYVAGRTYRLALTVSAPHMARAGFQASIRIAEGKRYREQAGSLSSCDERTEIIPDDTTAVSYARQTLTGAAPTGQGEASWCLDWTAPPGEAGALTLYVAGNAANYDDSEFGDRTVSRHWPIGAPRGYSPKTPRRMGE